MFDVNLLKFNILLFRFLSAKLELLIILWDGFFTAMGELLFIGC